jgi:hypothetical protein
MIQAKSQPDGSVYITARGPAITADDAMTVTYLHHGTCCATVGPRGGVTRKSEVWRRNGKTQTWKSRPGDYRLPVKHGLKSYDAITPQYADAVHDEQACPLRDLDDARLREMADLARTAERIGA